MRPASTTTKIILLVLLAATLGLGLDAQVDDSASVLFAVCETGAVPACPASAGRLIPAFPPLVCARSSRERPRPRRLASGLLRAVPLLAVYEFPSRC